MIPSAQKRSVEDAFASRESFEVFPHHKCEILSIDEVINMEIDLVTEGD